MKIYLESAGCTRRKVEVTKFHDYFRINGYQLVDHPRKADYILLSTCAFKKEEEDQSFDRVRELAVLGKKMVIYGCLPDIAPARFSQAFAGMVCFSPKNIHDIDTLFPDITTSFADVKETHELTEKDSQAQLASNLRKLIGKFEFSWAFIQRAGEFVFNKLQSLRNREQKWYYLYISKGCLGTCTYCAIRYSIGTLVSKPPDAIRSELVEGIASGHRNFILLGDDVGAYGTDRSDTFPHLLQDLIETAQAAGTDIRFHIEEIHPHWLLKYEKEMLEIIKSGRISGILCPIQSGNSRILDAMHRTHDSQAILTLTKQIKALQPGMVLATQAIVGFPSETESDFEDTLRVVKESHFDIATIFPYDAKENTPAQAIEPKVPGEQIAERAQRARSYLKRHGTATYLNCSAANARMIAAMAR